MLVTPADRQILAHRISGALAFGRPEVIDVPLPTENIYTC
jgi:hypothetical protein